MLKNLDLNGIIMHWVLNLEQKLTIQTVKKKKKKSRNTRKNISTDQSRIWNMVENWQFNNSANDNSRTAFLIGYLHDEKK